MERLGSCHSLRRSRLSGTFAGSHGMAHCSTIETSIVLRTQSGMRVNTRSPIPTSTRRAKELTDALIIQRPRLRRGGRRHMLWGWGSRLNMWRRFACRLVQGCLRVGGLRARSFPAFLGTRTLQHRQPLLFSAILVRQQQCLQFRGEELAIVQSLGLGWAHIQLLLILEDQMTLKISVVVV